MKDLTLFVCAAILWVGGQSAWTRLKGGLEQLDVGGTMICVVNIGNDL